MDTSAWLPVAIVVLAVLIIGAFLLYEDRRRARLHAHFGPELSRAARDFGPRRAERAFEARARRVSRYKIVPLSAPDRVRFGAQWTAIQAEFVDAPAAAVRAADALVGDVMVARGYPAADPDRRVEDLSVAHPRLVDDYRAARAIATREASGSASTEELRQALVHYRALFQELLGTADAAIHAPS